MLVEGFADDRCPEVSGCGVWCRDESEGCVFKSRRGHQIN